jgi:hypothetical protein
MLSGVRSHRSFIQIELVGTGGHHEKGRSLLEQSANDRGCMAPWRVHCLLSSVEMQCKSPLLRSPQYNFADLASDPRTGRRFDPLWGLHPRLGIAEVLEWSRQPVSHPAAIRLRGICWRPVRPQEELLGDRDVSTATIYTWSWPHEVGALQTSWSCKRLQA